MDLVRTEITTENTSMIRNLLSAVARFSQWCSAVAALALMSVPHEVSGQVEVAPEAVLLRDDAPVGRSAQSVRYSPDGRIVATGTYDKMLQLSNEEDGRLIRTLRGPTGGAPAAGPFESAAFSPDGKTIAAVGSDKVVRLWNVLTGAIIRTLPMQGPRVDGLVPMANQVAFSPDGQKVAAALEDGSVRLWNPTTGAVLRTLRGHSVAWGPSAVAFHPDGRRLVSGGGDGMLALWDVDAGVMLSVLGHDEGGIFDVAVSADGRIIASAGGDALQVWEIANAKSLLSLKASEEEYFVAVALSPDGRRVALSRIYDGGEGDATGFDRWHDGDASRPRRVPRRDEASESVEVWDVRNNRRIGGLSLGAQYFDLDFRPDGLVLAAAGNRGDSGGVLHFILACPFDLEVLAAYPEIAKQLAPRDEFETQPEFVARLGKGQRAYLDTLRSLEKAAALELAERVRASRETVELPAFSEASGVTLGRYDADRGRYGITVDGRDTSIAMPPAEARELSASRERAMITAIRQLSPGGERLLLYNRELIHPVTRKRYPIGERLRP
ncbi:MAG: WD40 repeat domain-containing protein [Verrucomicrobia bacterium]|nr:WD40 repeat domain-containing protein [Verrucomicrobiota bacterium]